VCGVCVCVCGVCVVCVCVWCVCGVCVVCVCVCVFVILKWGVLRRSWAVLSLYSL